MKTKKKLTANQLHDLYFRGDYEPEDGGDFDMNGFSGWWYRILHRIACDEVSETETDLDGGVFDNRIVDRIEEAVEEWEQVIADQIHPRSKRMIRQGEWYTLF